MKIVISGGGTGGHVFPAISIAKAIQEIVPNAEILFVGAEGKLEMEKVPAAGFKIIGLPVAGFQRKLTLKNFVVLFKLWKSLQKARKIIKDFRPDIAIGVGGYASGPVLKAAERKGIPTLLQEQNSYAGVTNKLLARKAAKICVAYDNMENYFPEDKIVYTGNPVRQNLVQLKADAAEAKQSFGFQAEDKVVLILGGSLGARTLNEAMLHAEENIHSGNLKFIWQTGKYYYKSINASASENLKAKARVMDFIADMEKAYAAADIIVSRAGAGTISELALIGKPVILVPSPNVAEDHQTKNAKALVEHNAAILIKDIEAKQTLISSVFDLVQNEEKMNDMAVSIKKLAMPKSAELIAKEALKLIEK